MAVRFLRKPINFFRRVMGVHHIVRKIHGLEEAERSIRSLLSDIDQKLRCLDKAEDFQYVHQLPPGKSTPLTPEPCPYSYPSFSQKHVEKARLYATRKDMIEALTELKNGKVIAEVGVAQGNFSAIMIEALNPREFVAFDVFDIHLATGAWGKNIAREFGGKTHLEFYKSRFPGVNLKTEMGNSAETLSRYTDQYFDMIYIDGDHGYDGVKADAQVALKKMKPDGMLIFNDYITSLLSQRFCLKGR